jgi:hypothetical protein
MPEEPLADREALQDRCAFVADDRAHVVAFPGPLRGVDPRPDWQPYLPPAGESGHALRHDLPLAYLRGPAEEGGEPHLGCVGEGQGEQLGAGRFEDDVDRITEAVLVDGDDQGARGDLNPPNPQKLQPSRVGLQERPGQGPVCPHAVEGPATGGRNQGIVALDAPPPGEHGMVRPRHVVGAGVGPRLGDGEHALPPPGPHDAVDRASRRSSLHESLGGGGSLPGSPAPGLEEEGGDERQQEHVGGHGPRRAAEPDVQNEREGEQPHRPRELSRERSGHARGHRQTRRGEEGEDGSEETQTPPSRLTSENPLLGQGESGQEGKGEVERQRERPTIVRACARPAEEAQDEGDRARRPERPGRAEQRQGGEGEDRRRIVGDVAHHEPGDPRHHRLGPLGRARTSGTGLPPGEERRHQLRRGEQHPRRECPDQAPLAAPRVSPS